VIFFLRVLGFLAFFSQMKNPFPFDSEKFHQWRDEKAAEIATSHMDFSGFEISTLIRASKYAGEGWSQSRRSEIVKFIRPMILAVA